MTAAPGNTDSIGGLLRDAVGRLHISATPRLDAELLLAASLGATRTGLIVGGRESLDDQRRHAFSRLVDKRAQGWPVAYLLGRTEFWSLEFLVDERVLIPRPDTELLVENALGVVPSSSALTIADVGTGSGAVAVALARERPACHVIAVDDCADALQVARDNVEHHRCRNVSLVRGDWLGALAAASCDIVVANPPYVAAHDALLDGDGLRFEPRHALCAGADGLASLRAVVAGAASGLKKGGWLVVEHGCEQGAAVRRLMHAAGFDAVVTKRDLGGLERVCAGRRKRT